MPLAMAADGLGPAVYGLVAALNGVLVVVLQPVLAPVLLARSASSMLAVGAAVVGLGCGLMALADSALGWALAMAVVTLGEIASTTVAPGLVAEIAPAALRGRYLGVFGMSFSLSFVLAPLLGAGLIGDERSAAPWLACLAICSAAAAGQIALGPALESRRAAARFGA